MEGLRTLEDLARFTRNDAASARLLKQLRHRLGAVIASGWRAEALERARDVAADPGTNLSTHEEALRTDLAAVARAAAGRLTQALRSLEEAAKVAAPSTAGAMEALRYEAYDVCATVVNMLHTSAPRQWRVCLLLDREACLLPWQQVLDAALDAGVDCIQIREKHGTDAAIVQHVRAVVRIAHAAGASVIVNDRPDVAVAADADGVHLGQDDMTPADARTVLGQGLLVGMSTHCVEEARKAMVMGVDYVGIGPIFASATKSDLVHAGPGRVADIVACTGDLPHLAIGGIDPSNVIQVAVAGGRGVAVGSAVTSAAEPGPVCRALVEAMAPSSVDA